MRLKICSQQQGLSGICLFHIILIQGILKFSRIIFSTVLYSFISAPLICDLCFADYLRVLHLSSSLLNRMQKMYGCKLCLNFKEMKEALACCVE